MAGWKGARELGAGCPGRRDAWRVPGCLAWVSRMEGKGRPTLSRESREFMGGLSWGLNRC